ncbi:AI-2E family transporter [Thermobrachium celere]|uniref:AI-2E family transporter n=1 Tax=Thermobrachium celere TaxID=53422 RepID=UPI0027DBACE2|nr:AI-2E family transporter [Thermobrachium celere]
MQIKFSRNIAVTISYASIIVTIFILSFVFIKYILGEINILYNSLSSKFEIVNLNSIAKNIPNFQNYTGLLLNRTFVTINNLLNVFIVLLISIILSLDFDKLVSNFITSFESKYTICLINAFIKLTSITLIEFKLAFVSTILTIVGFYILGIENALTIGLICGILDLLPVLGPALVFIPWSVIAFINKNYFLSVGLISLYILLQIIREVLQVKMVGNTLKIHPIISLFSLYAGVLIFKLWGIIFGPFMVIFTKELIDIERRIL